MSTDETEDRFRAAIRALNTGTYSDSLALGSLLASIQGDTRYELAAREELAPRAGELDLHLDGESVVDHSANAAQFGTFVMRIADGVKVIARDAMGRRAMTSDLLVQPGPGSVRVLFKTPDPVAPGAIDHDDAAGLWSDPNHQSVALLKVAQLLALAEPTADGESSVDALVETVPLRARPPLLDAVASITRENWSVEGEFRQRGLGVQPISLTALGAKRLEIALSVRERQVEHVAYVGTLGGHRRARSLCWFIDEQTGREITAIVPTPELLHAVADLSRREDQRVIASFTVTTSLASRARETGRKSFLLDSVRELPEAAVPLL